MSRTGPLIISTLLVLFSVVHGLVPIPVRPDGFVYKNRLGGGDSIKIEAFFDPVCPDSRDSWPPLKQALHYYGHSVSLTVHLLPLPYHDNAFLASRALHIVNGFNTSATYPLLEKFFKHQEQFYNLPTRNLSRAAVIQKIVNFASKAVGNSHYTTVEPGFNDRKTDLITRISFKYSCSRGVNETPFFFVNGFRLADSDATIDYKGWRSIIDPLLRVKGVKGKRLSLFSESHISVVDPYPNTIRLNKDGYQAFSSPASVLYIVWLVLNCYPEVSHHYNQLFVNMLKNKGHLVMALPVLHSLDVIYFMDFGELKEVKRKHCLHFFASRELSSFC